MDPKDLVVGDVYKVSKPIEACFYVGEGCLSTNLVDLPKEYELRYVGPDVDEKGYVFETPDQINFCLHDDDLASIEAV